MRRSSHSSPVYILVSMSACITPDRVYTLKCSVCGRRALCLRIMPHFFFRCSVTREKKERKND
ncbi:hypothetical protein BDV26DRAFT_259958 [Aspergillus bertholletiae]|uniref:Uncharacterized protein n=1 Tax=Aspergillus bertholletiae TaxID=1226010 RepID=A0A5N7BBQ5_9EURO|nr:hypothetical protein BDV26DRAFT_259958 [Aspergillus bertholletiae]